MTDTKRKRNNIIYINLEENIGIGCLKEKDEDRKKIGKMLKHLLPQLNTVLRRYELISIFHTTAKAGLGFTISSRMVHWLSKAVKHRTTL